MCLSLSTSLPQCKTWNPSWEPRRSTSFIPLLRQYAQFILSFIMNNTNRTSQVCFDRRQLRLLNSLMKKSGTAALFVSQNQLLLNESFFFAFNSKIRCDSSLRNFDSRALPLIRRQTQLYSLLQNK